MFNTGLRNNILANIVVVPVLVRARYEYQTTRHDDATKIKPQRKKYIKQRELVDGHDNKVRRENNVDNKNNNNIFVRTTSSRNVCGIMRAVIELEMTPSPGKF
jgi:hypothetical protein